MKFTKFLMLGVLLYVLYSCEKDVIPLPEEQPQQILSFEGYDDIDPPSGPGETVLGEELTNPYSLRNINEAFEVLYGTVGSLQATHYYLRLLPTTYEHVLSIADYEDEYGYEFETQPIHFAVTYQGDEDYRDL